MAFLHELPVEVVSTIVDACDRHSLIALCLMNKPYRSIAQKSLYRYVDLRTLTECIMCFRTLLARPDLAMATRDFLVMFESTECIFRVFWTMLSKVLALTNNLTSLHFAAEGSSNSILRHCTFPRLRILSSVVHIPEELSEFLVRHPSIKQICLGGGSPREHLTLPASTLPALRTYLGSLSLARDIIPGRPVSQVTLAWTSRMSEEEVIETIGALATGTVPMRHFGCTTIGTEANRSIMQALAMHMPGLHTLRLNNFTIGRPLEDNFVFNVATVLQCFKELKGLYLPSLLNVHNMHDTYNAEQEAAEVTMVIQWKASCPTLECVTLPSCMEWRFCPTIRLWKRRDDVDDSRILGLAEPLLYEM